MRRGKEDDHKSEVWRLYLWDRTLRVWQSATVSSIKRIAAATKVLLSTIEQQHPLTRIKILNILLGENWDDSCGFSISILLSPRPQTTIQHPAYHELNYFQQRRHQSDIHSLFIKLPTTSCVLDPLLTWLLKDVSDNVVQFLTQLINPATGESCTIWTGATLYHRPACTKRY